MGCDIHFYVEKKVGKKWVSADKWIKEEGRWTVDYNSRFYHDRNYDLFAILANVRNGRGFAGCDTGDGFVPIDAPRGLPDDACLRVKNESKSWDGDGHSHSWFTVAELLAYDWTQTTKLRGFINGPEFSRWDRWARSNGDGPSSWCGGVSGKEITHVSADELESRTEEIVKRLTDADKREEIEATLAKETGNVYAKVEWTMAYHRTCREFWSDTIPKLLRLGKPEDVRIVFWFDN